MKQICIIIIILLNFVQNSYSQDYPYDINFYNFVNYKRNILHFSKDSTKFVRLFEKLDSIYFFGQGKLNVVQIGASHTQADIFSGQMRYRLQTFLPGAIGSRGTVFPYRMARSNNPSNYTVIYSGYWTCANILQSRRTQAVGLAGISAKTFDPNAKIKIAMNTKNIIQYDFNSVKIFTQAKNYELYDIVPDIQCGDYQIVKNDSVGYIEFHFSQYLSEVSFHLQKSDTNQRYFLLYGIDLQNDNSGITYSTVGVNGASITSWLSCEYFFEQLPALKPDWIVFFLGVNDGNSTKFNPEIFYDNYDKLLYKITQILPNCAITLIVPNDYYLFRKRPNPAVEKEQTQMYKLLEKYNLSLWSLYEVMGGFGSSLVWQRNGLIANDKVHLTVKGYIFAGDLLFSAFLQKYDYHLQQKLK